MKKVKTFSLNSTTIALGRTKAVGNSLLCEIYKHSHSKKVSQEVTDM